MIYLGVFSINDYLAFMVQANDTGGSAANLDSGSFTINFYESDVAAAGAVAAMTTPDTTFNTQLDSKTGLYSAKVQLTEANGFEAGKQYFARVTGTVDSETPAALYTWFVRPDGQSDNELSSKINTNIDAAISSRASAANLATVAGYIDTEIADIKAKTDLIPASPAAVGSAMTLADDAITVNKIADGALTAAKFAAGAFDAVWSVATRTLSSFGTLVASIWESATRSLTDKSDFALSSASRAAVADDVWDEALAGHTVTGSAGAQLTAAGASGDPWSSVVPGSYAEGTAGAQLGKIGSASATVAQVIGSDLTIYIVRGCDYSSDDGKQIAFSFPNFTLTGYTLRINIERSSSGYLTKDMTILTATTAKAELTASETSQLTAGIRKYDVEALKDGRVISLISRSKAIIYEDVK